MPSSVTMNITSTTMPLKNRMPTSKNSARLSFHHFEEKMTASAWSAFGRLTHTVQDFYAHSNYIDLWLSRHTNGSRPAPFKVDPVEPAILGSGALQSGKIYFPLEIFSFIQVLKPLVLPLLPRDSHAWMNIDSPRQGFKFEYVMQASIKRTVIEFEKTVKELQEDRVKLFVDR